MALAQRDSMLGKLEEDYRNVSTPQRSGDIYGGGGGTAIGRGTPNVGHDTHE